MISAKKAKIKTYIQSAKYSGADFKMAKEILGYVNTAIKAAIKEGLWETKPIIIAGCSEATFKIIKSKLLSKGYFFLLKSNNQVLIVYWE